MNVGGLVYSTQNLYAGSLLFQKRKKPKKNLAWPPLEIKFFQAKKWKNITKIASFTSVSSRYLQLSSSWLPSLGTPRPLGGGGRAAMAGVPRPFMPRSWSQTSSPLPGGWRALVYSPMDACMQSPSCVGMHGEPKHCPFPPGIRRDLGPALCTWVPYVVR